jgi:predicted RecA/RadA family phage recombinase
VTNVPLHWNLELDGGKSVLTGVEFGSVVALDVKEGNNVDRVRDGVLLLHKQEGDVRKRLGHLVSDEQHGREVLTIGGGQQSHDLTWRTKQVADDGDPWGKTTAQLWGLSMREESTNGGRSRHLADGECGHSLPQGGGKSNGKGEALSIRRFYSSRGEREGCGGPAHRR